MLTQLIARNNVVLIQRDQKIFVKKSIDKK